MARHALDDAPVPDPPALQPWEPGGDTIYADAGITPVQEPPNAPSIGVLEKCGDPGCAVCNNGGEPELDAEGLLADPADHECDCECEDCSNFDAEDEDNGPDPVSCEGGCGDDSDADSSIQLYDSEDGPKYLCSTCKQSEWAECSVDGCNAIEKANNLDTFYPCDACDAYVCENHVETHTDDETDDYSHFCPACSEKVLAQTAPSGMPDLESIDLTVQCVHCGAPHNKNYYCEGPHHAGKATCATGGAFFCSDDCASVTNSTYVCWHCNPHAAGAEPSAVPFVNSGAKGILPWEKRHPEITDWAKFTHDLRKKAHGMVTSEPRAAEACGIDVKNFKVFESAADFYILSAIAHPSEAMGIPYERFPGRVIDDPELKGFGLREAVPFKDLPQLKMVRDDARSRLREHSHKIESVLLPYMDMIVGGELRHSIEVQARFGGSNSRARMWWAWRELRKQFGAELLLDAEKLFLAFHRGGYGGPPWANIARTVWERETHRITSEQFCDRVWSLIHNGGCALNKLDGCWPPEPHFSWPASQVPVMLAAQQNNPPLWGVLLMWASDDVVKLWNEWFAMVNWTRPQWGLKRIPVPNRHRFKRNRAEFKKATGQLEQLQRFIDLARKRDMADEKGNDEAVEELEKHINQMWWGVLNPYFQSGWILPFPDAQTMRMWKADYQAARKALPDMVPDKWVVRLLDAPTTIHDVLLNSHHELVDWDLLKTVIPDKVIATKVRWNIATAQEVAHYCIEKNYPLNFIKPAEVRDEAKEIIEALAPEPELASV